MANRTFNQFQGSLEKGVVQLYAEISFPGGTGNPTLVVSTVNGGCKGMVSMTRTGTGVYELLLQDSYVRLLGFTEGWKNASATPNIGQFVLSADTVTDSAAPKLTFTAYSQATTPAAADVGAGNTLYLGLSLSNSTAL